MRTAFQAWPSASDEVDVSGSLEEARNKCVEDYRCEVVCYHRKTGKTQLYQHFEEALKELGGSRKAWKEVLQKAPAWYDNDWSCLQVSPSCRRRAAKVARKQEEEGLKETLKSLDELRFLQQSLHGSPPPAFQTQGSLTHDAANFLGLLGFPMGKQASELREKCTDIASQVIRAREVSELGRCSGRIWVHRPIKNSEGRWQECCEDKGGLRCKDRFVIPADSCKDCQGVCLRKSHEPGDVLQAPQAPQAEDQEGDCLQLGSPGSWSGSGGQVVELMSAVAPLSPTSQAVLESCLSGGLATPLSRRRRRGFL